ISLEKLSIPAAGGFYHPRLNESGDLLLLTGENYKSLSLFNLKSGELKKITDSDGAGYSPQISGNGETVLFAENEFIQNRLHTKLMAWYKPTGLADQVAPPARDLVTLFRNGDEVFYKADGQLKSARIGSDLPAAPGKVTTGIEERRLMIYINNQGKAIDPMKSESYIWPSVSPDGNKILAYAMGKGAFICNTEGILIKELCNLEAPVWAGEDFVAGMVTKDDGHKVISAEIVLVDLKSGKKQKVSPEGVKAMYPSVAPAAGKLAFHSEKGEIYMVTYRVTP
ncbi:MAG TPA: hypothetical protein PLW67_03975, partial [Prolixibacteraceae bacterium]|nr:hypothetical protein [Prolixibacteraceae bacterium]